MVIFVPNTAAYAQEKDRSPANEVQKFGIGLDDRVRTIQLFNDEWVVGGDFLFANETTLNYIARWDGQQWRSLQSGLNGIVHALATTDLYMYVGGDFTEVGSQTVNRVVRWDGFSWQAMGTGVNGSVHAIIARDNEVYIGGEFTLSGSTVVNHVARWNGSNWQPMDVGVNGTVHALAFLGNNIVVGGDFTQAGSTIVNRIAMWNGSTWSALGGGFDDTVLSLATSGATLFAGGSFNQSESISVSAIARWEGGTWSTLGSGLDGEVRSISAMGNRIMVGGELMATGGVELDNIALWDGSGWSNPGGTDQPVDAITFFNDIYYVGGNYTSLAGQDVSYFSRAALQLPEQPKTVFPQNGALQVTTEPVFQWLQSTTAFSYQLQISKTQTFETLVYDISLLDANSSQPGILDGLTDHYYRVRAVNNLGNSDWSDVATFRTRLSYPIAILPENMQTGLGSNVMFTWSSVAEAQSYLLQVSNSESFESTLIADESGLSQTTFSISGLSDNTTYYWRLKSERIGSESDWSPARQFTVNLPPPTPLLISPANAIQNIDTLNVQFRWGPVLNASEYQFQLSLSATFESIDTEAIVATTQFTVPKLRSDTNYYWRVRALNIGGESAWSGVRTLTTIPAPPAQVVLLTPANNQSDVLVSPTMTWRSSTNADSYRIQVSTTQSFSNIIANVVLTDTSYQVRDLLVNRTYYWRVLAQNDGGESPWTLTFAFSTTNVAAPGQPVLNLPGNNAVDLPTTIQFTWLNVPNANKYRFQLSLSANFTTLVKDTIGVESLFYLYQNLLQSEKYYWRVSAINDGGEGVWSAIRAFETEVVIPAQAIQVAPVNDNVNTQVPVKITWLPVQGAKTYTVQLSTDQAFLSQVQQIYSGLTATTFQFSETLPQTRYYWRVRAANAAGEGEWSETWWFTTVSLKPDQVSLISPTNEALNTNIPTVLRWAPATRSEGYRVQLSNIPDFDSAIIADINVTNTFYSVANLNKGTTYYWRVAGFNSGGQGDWSVTQSFSTVPEPPLVPVLLSPPSNLDYISQPVILIWSTTSFVERYHLQLSLSPDFQSQLVIDDMNIPESQFDFTGTSPLPFNTIHYWRVRAFNSSGVSPWSQTRLFRTLPELPAIPQLIQPADNAVMVFMPLAFQWSQAARAQGYDIQLSETKSFDGELVIDAQNYNDITLIIDNLKPEQEFYWRVASRNVTGLSAWSDTSRFVTAPQPPGLITKVAPLDGSNQLKREQTFTWRNDIKIDSYQLQISTNPLFETTLFLSGNLTDTTQTFFLPNLSTTYYWRVRGINVSGIGPWTIPSEIRTFTYSTQVNVQARIPFENTRQSSYRLAALSGDSNLPIAFTFEDHGKQGTDWNAYAETGASNGEQSQLVEVSGNSSGFNFRPGRGFWVLSRHDWEVSRTFSAVVLSTSETYSIPLVQGWNIIANPFAVNVSWSSVTTQNGLGSDPIYAFEGLWITSNQLEPNTGYYFFNRNNRSDLVIPYPISSVEKKAENTTVFASNSDQTVNIDTKINLELKHNEHSLAQIHLSVNDIAHDGYDAYDHVAPPAAFADARMAFIDDSLLPSIKAFSALGVASNRGIHDLDFNVTVSESGDYELILDTALMPDWDGKILDIKTGRILDFTENKLSIYLISGSHSFKLIVGTIDNVTTAADELLPTEFKLFDAYPNPFNPTTTINFALPNADQVVLSIYDVAGRRVATLVQGSMSAGYQSVIWNAQNNASGIYIIELVAGKQRSTTKVALVK